MKKKNNEFKIGEIVVYPKHGVGEIIKIENMEIGSIKTKFYVVKMEQAKLTIRVPIDKQVEVGLRKISSKKIVEDVFVSSKEIKIFKHRKIKTKNTHGTGCTLSSAIATFLSCGKPLKKSCELGIKYVNQAIKSNLVYGKGHGPINHLNSIIVDKKYI